MKWASRYKDGHWFGGKVLRVFPADTRYPKSENMAVVDDGTGRKPRVIPCALLFEVVK